MRKIVFSIFCFLFLFPLSVSAASCTKEQISRYEQLASAIQTTFEYKETEEGLTFDILFHNVHEDLYIINYNSLASYEYKNSGIITAHSYMPGQIYKFSVLNYNGYCETQIVRSIIVTTPNYNKYYKDPVCDGVNGFELCQKWANIGNISYERFVEGVNDYKEKNKVNEVAPEEETDQNVVNDIRSFLATYYIYIIICILIIASIIMYLVNKKNKNKW